MYIKSIEENKYWIWLSLIPNLGSIRKHKLIQLFKEPQKIYQANKSQLMQIEGIGEKIVENILNNEIKKDVDKHLIYLKRNNINLITIQDKEYPQILKNIYDYPVSLYIKGNANILNNLNIAIIGCRDASKYGKESAKYFSYNLANKGICVVSGLAKGIDSYAHIGALGGKR